MSYTQGQDQRQRTPGILAPNQRKKMTDSCYYQNVFVKRLTDIPTRNVHKQHKKTQKRETNIYKKMQNDHKDTKTTTESENVYEETQQQTTRHMKPTETTNHTAAWALAFTCQYPEDGTYLEILYISTDVRCQDI